MHKSYIEARRAPCSGAAEYSLLWSSSSQTLGRYRATYFEAACAPARQNTAYFGLVLAKPWGGTGAPERHLHCTALHYTHYTTHYTLHYTLHITHYTLHITHYTTHYTLHITQYTLHYTLHITHYTLHYHYTILRNSPHLKRYFYKSPPLSPLSPLLKKNSKTNIVK